MNIPLSPCVPENLVSRDGFSRPVPRQSAHLHTTQAESGAYLRDSSRVPRRRPYETAIRHRVSPEFIGSRSCVSLSHTHYWYEVGMLLYRRYTNINHHAGTPNILLLSQAPIHVCLDGTIIDSSTILVTVYYCGYVGV